MRRYESYKPSGQEWLDEVPSHWEVRRNIGVFDERKEADHPEMELLSVTINRGVIKQEEITAKKDSSNEDKSKYKVVREGDLAYNKMRMWQGAIGASEYAGIVSPAYIVLRPRDTTYARYYHYLYRTKNFIAEANRHSYGLCLDMNSLRYQDFKTIYSPVPPRADVERIVTFLDQKTAEIDTAISKKEQLIKLLQEQKSILINQAITRGLNPDAPMRDSGVEWIGEVPAHWQERRLKMLSSFITSGPRGWSEILADEGAIFLQSGNLNDSLGVDTLKAHRVVVPKGAESKRTRLMDNDIVVCITGANTGRVAIANIDGQEAYINQHLSLIRLKESNPRFVAYSLSSQGRTYFYLCQYGLKEGLSLFNVANAPIVLPPLSEQEEIVSFLDEVVEQVDAAVSSAISQCDHLRELKSSVIAASVTGQIQH
ncbi:restriction endonuclease subunit S [Pseudomonas veronii]|uniref:restriction endonuclease subunit S n=1 Tax=Pseudomonas veronii TaxID=76761 RepID=UPI0018E83C9C|nr:restriction endonuclease subunit S [Pseudomonas veronii]MBJ2179524.1 restriction endonuclease subunit S [Pseudomonas veronii]